MAPKMRIPYLMNPVVDKAGTEGKSNNEVETSSSSRSKSGSRSSSASRSTPQRASNSGSGRQRRKFPEIYTCSDCKEKCALCPPFTPPFSYRFSSASAFRSHYGAAHLGGRSFHPCDECDRTYTTKAILKRVRSSKTH